jgi:hypothetical protein
MTIKPGHQTTGNAQVLQSHESSFMLFPTSGRAYIWRIPKETHNSKCLVPTVKHRGDSVKVWAAILWYSILLVPSLTFMAELLQGIMWISMGNQVHPMMQTLFPDNNAVFQDDNAPIHTSGTVQSWFQEHKGELQHFPWPA